MPRPWVLVFLLLLIVFTSQFEWKQQFGTEIEASSSIFKKEQYVSKHEEAVKEKIILSQEKSIQKLNELVRSLRKQLLQCRGENEVLNGSAIHFTEHLTELEQPPVLGDRSWQIHD